MGQWNKPKPGQPEGKLFWYDYPDPDDLLLPLMDRQVLFIFALEVDPHRRPDRPWEILKSEVARLDELVLRRQGLHTSIDEHAWVWVREEDAEQCRGLLMEQYGEKLNMVTLWDKSLYIVVLPS
ncbi:MAG: hypothetical protein HY713_02720 [candidate division NC10 bacterium]|nr:hypothetical protein [candidate division NC10 bacterium]